MKSNRNPARVRISTLLARAMLGALSTILGSVPRAWLTLIDVEPLAADAPVPRSLTPTPSRCIAIHGLHSPLLQGRRLAYARSSTNRWRIFHIDRFLPSSSVSPHDMIYVVTAGNVYQAMHVLGWWRSTM